MAAAADPRCNLKDATLERGVSCKAVRLHLEALRYDSADRDYVFLTLASCLTSHNVCKHGLLWPKAMEERGPSMRKRPPAALTASCNSHMMGSWGDTLVMFCPGTDQAFYGR